MGASRTKPKLTVDIAVLLPTLREAIEREGALKPAALTQAGIPKAQHPEAFTALARSGYERTPTLVRIPSSGSSGPGSMAARPSAVAAGNLAPECRNPARRRKSA